MIQFLGFSFFVVMFITGFWGIIFLSHMAIYWVSLGPLEMYGNKKFNEEEIRRKKLTEQEGVELLYSKN